MDEVKESEAVVTVQRPSMTQNSITPLRTHVLGGGLEWWISGEPQPTGRAEIQ